jgi:hypothetical protein
MSAEIRAVGDMMPTTAKSFGTSQPLTPDPNLPPPGYGGGPGTGPGY